MQGTLKEIGADVGDWVQFEDKQPYGPLTLDEILTDERTGFRIVKKSDRPLPKNCRWRLKAEGKAYPKSGCQACGTTIRTGVRCLHMFPEPDMTKPMPTPLVDKDTLQPIGGPILSNPNLPKVGENPAEEHRPAREDILVRIDDMIERSGINPAEWQGLRRVLEPMLRGKTVVDMAGAMDKITPALMEAMAPLLTQPMIQTLNKKVDDQMGVLDRVGKHLGVDFGMARMEIIGDRMVAAIDKLYDDMLKLRQDAVTKQAEVNAAKAQTADIGFHMLEIEGVVMSMMDTIAKLRDATGLTDENTPAEIVDAALARIAHAWVADVSLHRIRNMVSGEGKTPQDIENDVTAFFLTEAGDYWVNRDEQTGQWIVQQEPIKVVRSLDSEILVLRPIAAVNESIARKAFKIGYKARLTDLMQGGSQSSSDFFRDGRYAGRFHAFFPEGATVDEKIAHYEEMIGWERASKDATPLDFGDRSFKRADESVGITTPTARMIKAIGEAPNELLDDIKYEQSQDRIHRVPKTAVLPEIAWKEPDGIDVMRRELMGEETTEKMLAEEKYPLMAESLRHARSGKTTGC